MKFSTLVAAALAAVPLTSAEVYLKEQFNYEVGFSKLQFIDIHRIRIYLLSFSYVFCLEDISIAIIFIMLFFGIEENVDVIDSKSRPESNQENADIYTSNRSSQSLSQFDF